jgi:hypothetical protein
MVILVSKAFINCSFINPNGSFALARGINSTRLILILEGIVVVALLAWGIFAVLSVSTLTSPSSPGGIVNAVMRGITVSGTYSTETPGGIKIPPNSEAQFTMIFESNPVYDASKGWPQPYPVTRGEGAGWGPFLPSDPGSSFSSFTTRYAIFTFSLKYGATWLTGPQGQISSTYNFNTPPAGNWIVEVDSPGNYTLRFDNSQSGNATGQVSMSYSSVVNTPSRPYLYAGLATIGVAIALPVATQLLSWRKPKTSQIPPHLGKEIPADALGRY